MSKQTFLKDELLIRLKKAANFIPKKAVIPAYETLKFTVSKGIASITAIDGEKQITTTCNTQKSDGDVSFCLHGRLLINTLSLFLEQEVNFKVKHVVKTDKHGNNNRHDEITVTCGKSKYKFHSDTADVYPQIPMIESEFEASFTGSSFNAAIEVAKAYCNSESNVPAQTGITLRMSNDNKINFYGFSGFEIAKVSVAPRSINRWDDILIPVSAVNAINKCINDGDIVDVLHNRDKIEVRTDDVSIIAICFNTKTPNYDQFFDKVFPDMIEYSTFTMLTSLQRIKGFTDEEQPLVKININTAETVITATDNKYNRNGEEVVEAVSTTEHTFVVNVDFMINALSSFTNDTFKLKYTGGDPMDQIIIEPVGVLDNNNKAYLIAPMQQ